MKKLSVLLTASALVGLTAFMPAHAFELKELSREQATQASQRVAYMWGDTTEEAVSRFEPISDEVIALKASYAAKKLSEEEKIFVLRAMNPELFKDAPEDISVAVDLESATLYFFGREAPSVKGLPNYTYLTNEQPQAAYNIKIKSISPNVGPRMYVVADVIDGPVEGENLNVIARLDMTVEPDCDAPLGWSVLTYELNKPYVDEAVDVESMPVNEANNG